MDKESINKGKQLAFARIMRGYSQLQLVRKIDGLVLVDLSKYENGFKDSLSDELVKSIMDFLDWPIDWLNRNPICRIDVKY